MCLEEIKNKHKISFIFKVIKYIASEQIKMNKNIL